jgi:two-component sensor histidine kinase
MTVPSWMKRGLVAAFCSVLVLGMEMFYPSEFFQRAIQCLIAATGYTALLALFFLLLNRWLILNEQLPPPRAALQLLAKLVLLYLISISLLIGAVRLAWYPAFGTPFGHAMKVVLIGLAVPCLLVGYDALRFVLQAQQALQAAELRATHMMLRAQLQPHTLLNALNGIAALIRVNPLAAEQSIERLGHILRKILEAAEHERWSLEEEFEVLEHYIYLQQLRMGDRLRVSMTLAAELQSASVPPLLLLPLVENAFKHGLRRRTGTCQVQVLAIGKQIDVIDNGHGFMGQGKEQIGLKTVRLRLGALGGRLEWIQAAGCHVRVCLP